MVCKVGLRLEVEARDDAVRSRSLDRIFPSWVNTAEWWFLTKKQTLLRCESSAEIDAVQRNKGFLYHPEAKTTELILVLNVDLETAKTIARNSRNYTADLVVEDLEYRQAWEWGYFLRSELFAKDWNCEELVNANQTGVGVEEAPTYFRVEMKSYPWMVGARLVSATLKDQTGQILASYKRH